MVQVVENWAILEGSVEEIRPSEVRDDLAAVDVAVEQIEPFGDFPNLFPGAEGTVVAVTMPKEIVRDRSVEIDSRVRCRVRRASPFTVFAKPDEVSVLEPGAPTSPLDAQ